MNVRCEHPCNCMQRIMTRQTLTHEPWDRAADAAEVFGYLVLDNDEQVLPRFCRNALPLPGLPSGL